MDFQAGPLFAHITREHFTSWEHMVETAQILNPQSLRQSQERPRVSTEESEPFSLALAAATLQTQAALSLEIHGPAPSNTAVSSSGLQQSATSAANTRDPLQGNVGEQTETIAQQSNPDRTANNQRSQSLNSLPQSPDTNASVPQQNTATAGSINNAIAPLSIAPQQQTAQSPQNIAREAAALRDTNGQRNIARGETAPQTARTTETQLPQQDFARLLARRVDRATSFELRLDPPELGRVEGRVTISDQGKTVLALKFENQTALDLFSNDQASLRTALEDAGYNLENSDLAFSLADQTDPSFAAVDFGPHAPAEPADASYDPVFLATFSEGAIDIRI